MKSLCIIAITCTVSLKNVIFAQLANDRIDSLEVKEVVRGDSSSANANYMKITPTLSKVNSAVKGRRSWIVGASHATVYSASMLILNNAWYSGYPRCDFHFFNDNAEWLQQDKLGHLWSAYHISRLSMSTWQWAGNSYTRRVWLGGLSGVVFKP